MKYRVVVRDSTIFPFSVERGTDYEVETNTKVRVGWFKSKNEKRIDIQTKWFEAGICNTIEEAQTFISKDIERTKRLGKEIIPGNVVFEYDEQDMIVDKLKGISK
jgi:hypothetical protein